MKAKIKSRIAGEREKERGSKKEGEGENSLGLEDELGCKSRSEPQGRRKWRAHPPSPHLGVLCSLGGGGGGGAHPPDERDCLYSLH